MESKILEKEEIEQKTPQEIEQEEQLLKKREKNKKIYPIYRMFSWDLLFYYAIIYLFLTIEKKITPAQALQFDAFYIFFRFLTQIPCTILIDKIGKRKSLVIANLLLVLHIIIIIASRSFIDLLISQLLCAFAYNIKTTSESDMLYDSLEPKEERGNIFAKIDGRATSFYYYIDAISAIIAGFLFVVNAYIPMLLCLSITIISFIVSIKFEDVQGKRKKITVGEELKHIRYAIKNVFRSKRLRGLILFDIAFISMVRIIMTMRNTTLKEIGMPAQYFGIIFAIIQIIAGIATKNQENIHKKYRNTTLCFLGIPMAISILGMGFTVFLGGSNQMVATIIIILLLAIQSCVRGPFYVLIKRYLNNFTTSEKRVKITTATNLFENLAVSFVLFAASFIMELLPISYSLILIGSISIIGITFILDFMRGKVGLKMEEYGKKEIL